MSKIRSKLHSLVLIAIAGAALQFATPAAAQRGIVIDVAGQSNPLVDCGTNCLDLTTGYPGGFTVFTTGAITLRDSSHLTFFIAESATVFQVLSGFTVNGIGQRTDFVNFFQQGRTLGVGDPDFQIQLRNVNTGGPNPGLEIAFAYDDFAGVPAGARIGYSGNTTGLPGLTLPAEHFVTNANGLLLGQQAINSNFVFTVGTVFDANHQTVRALVSESFRPLYAAGSAVPEPSTWAMMLFGFGAVGLSLRRRRRTHATV